MSVVNLTELSEVRAKMRSSYETDEWYAALAATDDAADALIEIARAALEWQTSPQVKSREVGVITLWRTSKWPTSRWRRAARMAIVAVVDACSGGADHVPADIIERVDAAYPFGERKYQPYKEWLKERRLFIEAIRAPVVVMPSADEVAACEVARDAIEDGRDQTIVARLLEQAPHRLARKCQACGARPGSDCLDITPGVLPPTTETLRLLAVPHHARLVGHIDAGLLFTQRSP